MNATKPTIRDVERMATGLVDVVNCYLIAKANAQLWRERVEPIQRDMLRIIRAVYGRAIQPDIAGKPITDPRDAWRMGDEQHRDWCTELDHEYRKRGWLTADDDVGVCPALKAEELERQAARAVLLKASEYVGHLEPDGLLCAGLEAYRKGLNLTVALVVNHSTYRKPAILAA